METNKYSIVFENVKGQDCLFISIDGMSTVYPIPINSSIEEISKGIEFNLNKISKAIHGN